MSGSSVNSLLTRTRETGPLLRLPVELRTKILRAVLCQVKPISYSGAKDDDDYVVGRPKWLFGCPELAILSTCRQMYHEGVHIFFTQNTFDLTINVHDGACGYDEDLELLDFVGFKNMSEAFEQCPNFRHIMRLSVGFSTSWLGETRKVLQQEPLWIGRHLLKSVPRYLEHNLGRLEIIIFEFMRFGEHLELTESDADLLMSGFKHLRADRAEFHEFSPKAAAKLKSIIEGE